MKILHFVPYYPPVRLGGVGMYVAALHSALRGAGYDSQVVTTGEVQPEDAEAQVHRIAKGPLGWCLRCGSWARRAAQADIVHCQAGEALPLLLRLPFYRRRGRSLATFHVSYEGMARSLRPYTVDGQTFSQGRGPLLERTLVAWLHRMADRMTIWLADGMNTISRASAVDILGARRAADADVVYYGLGKARETPASEALSPVELLYAGAGGHRKRITMLPAVLDRVRRVLPEARLRIVGFTAQQEPELVQLFAQRGLEQAVEWEGYRRPETLVPVYASAKVLLLPSAYEGLPLVLLEAMQSGVPAVATHVSGHPEAIVDGENGFLVDLDDPDQMAERALRLLQDPELWQRLSASAQRTVLNNFSMERHLDSYLVLYRRLLARS